MELLGNLVNIKITKEHYPTGLVRWASIIIQGKEGLIGIMVSSYVTYRPNKVLGRCSTVCAHQNISEALQ